MVGVCYDGVEGVLYLCLFSILAACAFTVMLCAIPRAWRQIACRSVRSLLICLLECPHFLILEASLCSTTCTLCAKCCMCVNTYKSLDVFLQIQIQLCDCNETHRMLELLSSETLVTAFHLKDHTAVLCLITAPHLTKHTATF